MSSIRQLPRSSPPLVIAYGTAELPELQRQSRDYHNARRHAVYPPSCYHSTTMITFRFLRRWPNSNGKLTDALVRLAAY